MHLCGHSLNPAMRLQHHLDTYPLWEAMFPHESRAVYQTGHDVVAAGDEVNAIFWVEQGALVETRIDQGFASHAVNLSGPGSIVGLRMTSTGSGIHEVRITALTTTILRCLPREDFLHIILRRTDLASAVMHDLAHRTELARRLADSAHADSTAQHLLDVLELAHQTFGYSRDGRSKVSIPPALLERMIGIPWLLIRKALAEMQQQGRIELNGNGIRMRSMVS